jgi:hypothetical protein
LGFGVMEKNLRIFFYYDERFYLMIQKIFAKNKYCNTVKIKKNAQTSFCLKVNQ